MDEAAFIALLRNAASGDVARGLIDDAAVFGEFVFTHDMMVEGIHYVPGADAADVAWKLLARNLSDLAAKGATPLGVLLGYVLGDEAWDRAFASGLTDALSHYETALWGGDTAASVGPRVLGMTAIGRARQLPVASRAGARPGDCLWVTGTLGLAFAGYRHDHHGANASVTALERFRRPVPRLAEGAALSTQVTAMMDVSDGLLLDATRLAQASGVTLAIARAAIPVTEELRGQDRDIALRWGDDYELLFTLPAGAVPCAAATCIGAVEVAGDHPLLLDGLPPDPAARLGWQHGPVSRLAG